jgi:tetraacyldisaccharide 4'-kinase
MKDVLKRFGRRGVSALWSAVNAARRGLSRGAVLPVPSIGVGNLQAGGAGKTPLVMEIAREALARGLSVAVLTRGYGSQWEKTGGILSPSDVASPEACGDEPALIHQRVPGLWIAVGADRLKSFSNLSERIRSEGARGLDLVILDDAFQHHAIRCDSYVLAITDAKPGDQVFRDAFTALRPEDFIVLTKGEEFPFDVRGRKSFAKLRFKLAPPEGRSRKFHFVAALADPERARALAVKAGYQVESHVFFPDHHAFTESDVQRAFAHTEREGLELLMTGKDAVKWKSIGDSTKKESGVRIQVIEPELEWFEGKADWDAFLTGAFRAKQR